MSRTRLCAILAALVLGLIVLSPAATRAGAAPAPGVTPTVDISPRPPTAPTGLRVAAVTSRSVTLTWTAATGGCCGVAGYEITVIEAFNDALRIERVGDVTTATLPTWPTRQYTYRVVAVDGVGHRSGSSNTVTVVTPRADTGDTTPPTAPTGLRVVDGATLSWTAAADDVAVTGYDLYRFDGLYISTLVATVDGTTAALPPTGAHAIFYVRARDAAGNLSAASNTVTVTNPTPTPTGQACRIAYTVTARWASGFVAEVAVTNAGPAPVDRWVATLRYGGDQRVTSAWHATFSQTGSDVTLTGASWNQAIPAGGTASAGVLGAGTAGAAEPVSATLNGVPCTVG